MAKRTLTFEQLAERRTLSVCPVADSTLGDDIHAATLDETTTPVILRNGMAEVCSFIDRDADHDAFRLESAGPRLLFEAIAEVPLIVNLYLADGELLTTWESNPTSPRVHVIEIHEFPISRGETLYFLVGSTKGGRGNFQLVVREPAHEIPVADLNGDGIVGFSDFLILSANFGRTADATLAHGDIDGDRDVDFADFLFLSKSFGAEVGDQANG